MNDDTEIRSAVPGERCTCGRQATEVFITDHGEVGYCGRPDGGRRGPCVFCGGSHEGRCPDYQLRADEETEGPL